MASNTPWNAALSLKWVLSLGLTTLTNLQYTTNASESYIRHEITARPLSEVEPRRDILAGRWQAPYCAQWEDGCTKCFRAKEQEAPQCVSVIEDVASCRPHDVFCLNPISDVVLGKFCKTYIWGSLYNVGGDFYILGISRDSPVQKKDGVTYFIETGSGNLLARSDLLYRVWPQTVQSVAGDEQNHLRASLGRSLGFVITCTISYGKAP